MMPRFMRGIRSLSVTLLTLAVIGVFVGEATASNVIPLSRDGITYAPKPEGTPGCYCPEPSQRNLLGRIREAAHKPGLRADAAIPKTLRVLGIRVQFPFEDPDDPLTTGRGVFDMRDTTAYFAENNHLFDASPHDRRYFETHLRALHLYWNTVSNGEISLQWTVFPQESDSVYTMPHEMSYYGRERGGDSSVVFGLEQFVIDAATAASQDPALNFEDYDAVIIFHAGSDRQSDIARDTPNDLFTGFVRLGHFISFNSLQAGIADQLGEAIIMPETLIQDNRITVLNAVMAHEFGHQLGLVDLYNTRSFLTQVGDFSLMDNNVADVGVDVAVAGRRRILFGALPEYPDAWSRYHLGFVDARVVDNATEVHVPAAEQLRAIPQVTEQVVRIPISETEYYLVENRRIDIDGQGDPGLRLDSMTNVVLEPADTLTVTGNREYDFLTPGSGLLIWHVDEGVAELDYVTEDDIPNNFQANTLQWDPNRRFVRLVEADGLINFGGFFSAGTGNAADYFFFPNNAELSEFTNPPASSNTGAPTGITISNISRPDNDMTMDVSREGPLAGFPVFAGVDTSGAAAPVAIDVTRGGSGWRLPGDGSPEVLTGYKNYVCGWDWDGHTLGGKVVIDTTHRYDDSLVIRTLVPVAAGDPGINGWMGPPLVADAGDNVAMVIAVATSGETYIWRTLDQDADGLLDVEYTRHLTQPVSSPMVLNRSGTTKELFVPVAGQRYVTIGLLSGDSSRSEPQVGEIMGAAGPNKTQLAATFLGADDQWSIGWVDGPSVEMGIVNFLPPVVGDIDRDSSLDAVFLDQDGHLFVIDADANPVSGFPIDVRAMPTEPPVLGDLDMDGYLDIVVVAEGYAYAYAHNGALLADFPVLLGDRNRPDSGAASPAIAALGSGDVLSLATAGWRQMLMAFDGDGRKTERFPHPLGAMTNAPVAWAVNTDISRSGLFARCEDGYLYGFDAPTSATAVGPVWPMARRDARGTASIPVEDLLPVSVDDLFFAEERTFVYPSPANGYAVVRYWLGDDADVHIRIFDVAGNLVTEADGPGKGGLYNEWTWDCSTVASGVYFAHVEANQISGGRTETVLCKMAVVQ